MLWYFYSNAYSIARAVAPQALMVTGGVSARNVQIACCAPSIYFSYFETPKNRVVTEMLTNPVFAPKKL
jgi:hypothetical protein